MSPSAISGISCSKRRSKNRGEVRERIIAGLLPLKSTDSMIPLIVSPFLKKSEGICLSLGKRISFPSSSRRITVFPFI